MDTLDVEGLAEFYAGLSRESRYLRFMGTSAGLPNEITRSLCTPDHEHAEGLVAELDTFGPDEGRIVGHICLVPADGDRVELAIAVADRFQHQGIGRSLFTAALAWARERGVGGVTATAFATNVAVLRLLESAPEGSTVSRAAGDVVSIEIPLLPLPQSAR